MATGLFYLCKTTSDAKQSPYEYKGSGKYWLRHIKKHKSFIITCVVGEYDTKEELKQRGVLLSKQLNIVESKQWANLTPEQGDGGWISDQTGKHWKVSRQGCENMCHSRLLHRDKYLKAHKEKLLPQISGGNNYQSKYYIYTPWGVFETYREATTKAKQLRKEGRIGVVTDGTTLRKYCESSILLNEHGRRTYPRWRGRYTKEIGFFKERKTDAKGRKKR